MADTRTYIRVHDGMPDHPKVDGLSDRAFRLLVESWCWCSRHLTNGRIPAATWKKRGTPKARKELLDAGLVEQQADGSVAMHDYLEHQRSAELVAEARKAKARGGSFGNHVRWHVDKGLVKEGCEHCPQPPDGDLDDGRNDPEFWSRKGLGRQNGTGDMPPVNGTVDNAVTSENDSERVANGSQNRSHMRSQTDRKTSPETVFIGGPAVPSMPPHGAEVEEVSQSAREAEALAWIRKSYGLTEDEARTVWGAATARARGPVAHPIPYLNAMTRDGSLALLVDAVQRPDRDDRAADHEFEPPPLLHAVPDWPAWCGQCAEHTRQDLTDPDRPRRCPRCHPLTTQRPA